VRREPGGRAVETVDWITQRGIVARAYDKGLESNTAPRGERVRLESQNRWPSGLRRDVDELTAGFICGTFRRRFEPLWRASKGVKVVSMENLAGHLIELVDAQELTRAQAEKLCGFLVLEAAGMPSGPQATRWRRKQLAQRVGLATADGVTDEVEVDLAAALQDALALDAWDRRD
jgi:hypothetical protein